MALFLAGIVVGLSIGVVSTVVWAATYFDPWKNF